MLTKIAIAGGVVALGGAWYFTQRLQSKGMLLSAT